MAPDSGENTRASIAKGTRKLADGLKGTLGESVDSLKNLITTGVDDVVKKGREVMPRGNDRATV
jgi:hypothetical protein